MSKPLVELTADKLIDLINKRRYQVGEKIPNEFELARELNVGRSTIREAVKYLVARNILEVRQGSGTYISDKQGIAEDPLGLALVKDTDKLLVDLFEFRSLIEPRIAELVAEKASQKDIDKLENLVDQIEDLLKVNDPRHIDLDIQLHSEMARMSGNIAFHNIIPSITKSIAIINDGYSTKDMRNTTIKMHRKILDSIKERNPKKAHDAMLEHVTRVTDQAKGKN